jgi:hypothetical protein
MDTNSERVAATRGDAAFEDQKIEGLRQFDLDAWMMTANSKFARDRRRGLGVHFQMAWAVLSPSPDGSIKEPDEPGQSTFEPEGRDRPPGPLARRERTMRTRLRYVRSEQQSQRACGPQPEGARSSACLANRHRFMIDHRLSRQNVKLFLREP